MAHVRSMLLLLCGFFKGLFQLIINYVFVLKLPRQTVVHLPCVLMERCMSPSLELWMMTGEKGDEY